MSTDLQKKIEEKLQGKVNDAYDLQNYIAQNHLAELKELRTEHFQCKNLYARQVFFDKNDVAVGRVHKKEHMALLVGGPFIVTTYICDSNDKVLECLGTKEYKSGDIIVSMPGTKRAAIALGDGSFICLHYAESETLDDLEEELMEKDYLGLYNSNNQLVNKQITQEAVQERIEARERQLIGAK